jgi:membrane protease YdiL (CAAX protease family)
MSSEQDGTMRIRSLVSAHPVAAYVLLTVAWSFPWWSMIWLFLRPGELLGGAPPVVFVFVVVGGFGPSLAGLLTTWLADGRAGLLALLGRLRIWRVGWWWLAVLLVPAVTALTPLLRSLAGHPADGGAMLALLGPGLGLGLTAGLMEELGWRGFLLPRLLAGRPPLRATLLLGLIWGGVWHGYADYFALGGRGVTSLLLVLMLGPLLLTAWSVVITWVYEGTRGSLLLSYAMHASISSSALIFGQAYTTSGEEVAWTGVSVGLAVVAAAVVWLLGRPRGAAAGRLAGAPGLR